MVLYMHLMLFFICVNFGLGIAHIPDTPLTIPNSAEAATDGCQRDMWVQGLLTRQEVGGVVTYVPSTDASGNPILYDFETEAGNQTNDSTGAPWDTFTNSLEAIQQAGETMKNVVLGGYVINILDSLTFNCDVTQYLDDGSANPTYGQAIDSEVMIYLKAGIHILFGMMLFLFVFYLITGRTVGF